MLNYFSSIRVRLLLLVALALLPILGLMLYSYQEQKQQAIIDGQQSALNFARMAAKDQDFLFEGARQLMIVMTQLPFVQNHDAEGCGQFLADLIKQFPVYENFGVAEANGDLLCSAIPPTQKVNLGDRNWFQRAIQTRGFVAGDYIIARVSGSPALTNAFPVFDERDRLSTVVFAGIDLRWLDQFVAEAQLPKGSTLTVVDQSGIILTRYPDAETWRGQALAPAVMQLFLTQGQGVSDRVGLDGVSRLYGFTRLCCMPGSSIFVQVGIPKEVALADANRSLARNLILFGLVILFGLIAAMGGANLFILRPLHILLNTIKEFDSGDFGMRVGKTSGGSELDQVARALDQMATAVEAREAERNHTEEMLRLQSAQAQALATTAARLNNHLDLQNVLDIVCKETAQALVVSIVSVSLFDDTNDTLCCVSHCGLPDDLCYGIEALGLNAFIPRLKLGEAIFSSQIQSHSDLLNSAWLATLKVSAFTCNPLMHEGKLVGILCVFIQDGERGFTEGELNFISAVSDQAAQAIFNAHLYRALREEQLSRAALLEKTISAQEDERKRIARELHDQTSQDLAALMLSLDACAISLPTKGPGSESHLQTAKALVGTILTNIHHLINDLRPSLLDDLGLGPAILWYDARASVQADRMRQSLHPTRLQKTVPNVAAIDAAPKIMWLRECFPKQMARARRYLLLPDYFAYRLTGRAVTDPSTASSTALYVQDAADYCTEALAAAGIARSALAEIQRPGQPIARVLPESAKPWGLDATALFVTGTNDQYAGALGAGNCRTGIVSVTTGTCLALVTLAEALPQPLPSGLFGGRFPIPRYRYALAYSKTAGVVLEWFSRELGSGRSLRDLDEMASHVPIGSRGLMMLPHFDGMISPVSDPDARGAFLNLSLHHSCADMYRAILEALGYTLNENLELLRRSGFDVNAVRAIGGAAKSDFWLQMVADITGMPIERPVIAEAAVLGAVMLAAVGSGAFSSLEESSEAFYKRERIFEPQPERHAVYESLCRNYVRFYRHIYGHCA